jgi:hypothetical protein
MAASSLFTHVVDSLLADGLHVRFRAAGRSMRPTVRDGECLVVAPVVPREVVRGDVVLCQTWRGPVAHRVVAVERDASGVSRLVLRGDASLEPDRPLPATSLRARVIGVERAGHVRSLARPGELSRAWRAAIRHARPMLAAGHAWLAPRPVAAGS